jgi:hypothetical protein
VEIQSLLDWAERLNLAAPAGLAGAHIGEMIAILAIVFGGSFLLFAYRHYDYFAGITGFLLGGWLGLMARAQYLEGSRLSPFLYMAASAVAGACIAVFYRRFVGILLGGFLALCATLVAAPEVLQVNANQNLSFALIFLLGGGLGALFPKFFFVANTSLIGAAFVTYGVMVAFGPRLSAQVPAVWSAVLHLLVFLPCLVFGILYQVVSTLDKTEGGGLGPQAQIVINAR